MAIDSLNNLPTPRPLNSSDGNGSLSPKDSVKDQRIIGRDGLKETQVREGKDGGSTQSANGSTPVGSQASPAIREALTRSTDQTSFSAAATALSAARTTSQEAPFNTSRIEALRAQIANGTYQPDSSKIAGKMLDSVSSFGLRRGPN